MKYERGMKRGKLTAERHSKSIIIRNKCTGKGNTSVNRSVEHRVQGGLLRGGTIKKSSGKRVVVGGLKNRFRNQKYTLKLDLLKRTDRSEVSYQGGSKARAHLRFNVLDLRAHIELTCFNFHT